jgi:ABC-type multidrug transport system fused ATPase/permease subunit
MDLNIKNTTLYNKDLIIKYNQFFSRSYIKKNFIIISIISLGFIIYMIVNQNWWYALLLVGIMLAYFLLTLLLQKFTIKRMLSKSPLVENPITQTYHFKSNSMTVINKHKTYEVPYDLISSVKNGKDFFLLKSTDNKSFIVDHAGFKSDEDYKELKKYFIIRFNMKE